MVKGEHSCFEGTSTSIHSRRSLPSSLLCFEGTSTSNRETDLDNEVRQQVVDVQESLKAETEFHIRTFERIKEEYRDEGVCSGTWIPVWAAAFNETVHMYEVSPVRTGWDETSDLFPATVFDMLDKTRKLEQADLAAGHQLKIVRTAARITSQGWYPERFTRKKRGAADAEPEVNVPIEDAFGDEPRIERNANRMFACMKCNDFENSNKGLVEMHEEVCGITLPFEGGGHAANDITLSDSEQALEPTQCARNIKCSRPNRHCGMCKINQKCATVENLGFERGEMADKMKYWCAPVEKVAEEAAAAEAETTEDTKETEQTEQRLANLLPPFLPHPPDLLPGRRVCVSNQQEATRAKWKTDVNAKLREVGAGLLRVMCITDRMKACKVDTLAAVEAGLSDEAKDILRERTDQLRKRRYGSYDYVAMLEVAAKHSAQQRPRVERRVHHGDSEIIDERRRHGTCGKAAGGVVDLEEELYCVQGRE